MNAHRVNTHHDWPALATSSWQPTRDTLHMYTQIVGKIALSLRPPINHWWHVTLHVSARGLTTGAIPIGSGVMDLEFDLIDHVLLVRAGDDTPRTVPLTGSSVADFYAGVMAALSDLGVEVSIHTTPNEVEVATPFPDDTLHHSYDPHAVHTFWEQLVAAEHVLQRFRSEFRGKSSPVHFFWGSMDLAVTRFSGRPAPTHPGGAPHCPDSVMREAYSRELSSAGFWPGGGAEGAFYSYAYPAPRGFEAARMPEGAFFSGEFGEFLLPYERARTASDPEGLVLDFLHASYGAAVELGDWPTT
jgi:hypothetical protein